MREPEGSAVVGIPALSRGGFTLVEMMVVVTIIVILIAILTPAVEKAMATAQAALCMSNIHSVKIGLNLYLNEYRRTYPYGLKGPAGTAYYPDGNAAGHWQNGARPPQQLLLAQTGNNTNVFRCPTHADTRNYDWWWFYDAPSFYENTGTTNPGEVQPGVSDPTGLFVPGTPGRVNLGSSYMFSEQALLGYADETGLALKASDIESPSTFGYMADGHLAPNGWNWYTLDKDDPRLPVPRDFWTYRISWSHNKEVHMLMGDGAVIRRPQKDIGYEVRSDPVRPAPQ